MKVLVLGHEGMLGHIVLKYLLSENTHCITIPYRWPEKRFLKYIKHFEGDYIINCIGQIPQKSTKDIQSEYWINYLLPIWLDQNTKARIIYPGTDCEMDADEYGESKKKASDWIKEKGKRTKIIKTSIIGPELHSKYSLMEWFLNKSKKCLGYSEVYWNGNTSLTWAKYSLLLMNHWEWCEKETILESQRISKLNLLKILKKLYNKKTRIIPDSNIKSDKCLKGIKTKSIKEQLIIMKEFLKGE